MGHSPAQAPPPRTGLPGALGPFLSPGPAVIRAFAGRLQAIHALQLNWLSAREAASVVRPGSHSQRAAAWTPATEQPVCKENRRPVRGPGLSHRGHFVTSVDPAGMRPWA